MMSEAAALLRRVPFLAGLGAAELDSIAPRLMREDFAAGESISSPVTGRAPLRFVARGKIELSAPAGRGRPQPASTLVPGDHWGEIHLFHPGSPHPSARALEPTTVYRWDRPDLAAYLRAHPTALRGLRFVAETRRLARSAHLHWLAPDEPLVALARRHPFFLVRSLVPPALVAGAGAWMLAGLAGGAGSLAGLGAGLVLAAALWAAWNWLDWTNDYYLITSRRAAWLERIVALYDSRRESPLAMVLSVDLSTDVVGRWLGFGDVTIRSYTGQLVFRGVGEPAIMAALVEETWHRVQDEEARDQKAEISAALRQALQPSAEPASPPNAGRPANPTAPRSVGLDHWTFQVRFEEKGVITYRKHWAVLVGQLALPSALILTVVAMVGAQLGAMVERMDPASLLLAATAALIPLLGWWVYRFADWANDIYQVTPDQIRDIYKKPLGREIRKVAPLENILGTEVDRKGLTGLVLNFGDVVTNIGASKFVFHGVYDPNGVQQDIARALESMLTRKREAQKRERQEEMVDWLTSYHEEAHPDPASGDASPSPALPSSPHPAKTRDSGSPPAFPGSKPRSG